MPHQIRAPANLDQAAVEREARENPKIQALLEGKSVHKVIHVPHKLVNIVAAASILRRYCCHAASLQLLEIIDCSTI